MNKNKKQVGLLGYIDMLLGVILEFFEAILFKRSRNGKIKITSGSILQKTGGKRGNTSIL